MPHYFFHLMGSETVEDDEGEHCCDLDAARRHAMKVAGELTRNQPHANTARRFIAVSDESGTELLRVPLAWNQESPCRHDAASTRDREPSV
jgi:hypothetical protein